MNFHPHDMEQLAQHFKILGEPARLQILSTLCDQERSVQDICQQTGLHQANASKHLRMMKDAGVVACRKKGVWRYYRIVAPEVLSLCLKAQRSLKQVETKTPLVPNKSQMEAVE
ncbi:MAG: winged helix-turn-helix transcriptional regulator [Acaryochloris sp. RU_4_1]|nr:winged helix-turn-helix transcriptional regulator [Acaryochloris sp. RU_4_1]